ncbi:MULTISPECIES: hypothetical protein [Acinetobacter]|uniref:hypothetical protein n=1 Tax=Acinetobacter TaxID=469 RepID=UPI0009946437|nr:MULTISPECIES: hypothetical protein [Acinetobacter]MCL6243361.1 carboxypeptidase regulatory-like domain-containing protein [Acinetobacter amyesii]OOV81743.1 hypothetical protein B1201_09960 [Acinetobacter sp. ANC 5600]
MFLSISPSTNLFATDSAISTAYPLSIKGVVRKKNINIPCRIRLYERFSGRLIDEVLSTDDGQYEFSQLSNVKYFIVAHDPASQFNAVIQDNVVPK